jgi:hypothetical protein
MGLYSGRCDSCDRLADALAEALCLGCRNRAWVCPKCSTTFTGCSKECQAKHRHQMSKGFLKIDVDADGKLKGRTGS